VPYSFNLVGTDVNQSIRWSLFDQSNNRQSHHIYMPGEVTDLSLPGGGGDPGIFQKGEEGYHYVWLSTIDRLLKKISLMWRCQLYRWRDAKFGPMLCAKGLWAGRASYRSTTAVTQVLGVPINWLFSGFTSHPRIFHLYEDVTIASEGLQNSDLCSALRAFEQGTLSCHTCCDTGPRFFRSHTKDHRI
jgi:hypothetical protein